MQVRPVRSLASDGGEERPGRRAERSTSRLLPLIVPVAFGGALVAAVSGWTLVRGSFSATALAGALVLFVAAALAEKYPVPMESLPAGHVSLAAVFVVGTGLIYGWEAATLIAFTTRALLDLVERRPLVRLVYNASVYGLAGAAAGAVAALFPYAGGDVAWLIAAAAASAASFYAVNLGLIAAVIARWAGEPFARVLRQTGYLTVVPFAIMASVSLMLYVLWDRSPVIAGALVGPLVAIVLYQRSIHGALAAMRLALTDALTGLGNRRHFHERLERDLDRADDEGLPLTICLLDVDDFKAINDAHGHDAGDRVLVAVGSCLRHGGEAFRIGGDEFALLLPGRDARAGLAVGEAVVARIARSDVRVSVSAGLATYPDDAAERSELLRLADNALYAAKRGGKNGVRAYVAVQDAGAEPAASAA